MHHVVYVQSVFNAIQELESRHFVRRGFDLKTHKTEWRSPHGDFAEIIIESPLHRVKIEVTQFNGSPFTGFARLIGGPCKKA